ISIMIKTVKVCNLSLGASERDVQEFFSFSGDIEYVEMQSDTVRSQIAFVTFKDAQGAETAILLSVSLFLSLPLGATIIDMTVEIQLDPDYKLPPAASAPPLQSDKKTGGGAESALQKAEDVVSSMLAKGFILGKDAVNKAKSFDEKHQLTSTASAKVSSLDKKIGLTEKITIGTSIVNEKVREVDEKLHVSEKAKSAFAAAEQTVSSAGTAIMKNRYVLTGTTWVTGAFSKVTKAAGEVGQKTKEKVVTVEDEQRRKMVDDFAQVHLSESPKASDAAVLHPSKPAPAQGLIL
ncbi:RNA-binding family protein, partial [Perilla frutescens var. hirtella]